MLRRQCSHFSQQSLQKLHTITITTTTALRCYGALAAPTHRLLIFSSPTDNNNNTDNNAKDENKESTSEFKSMDVRTTNHSVGRYREAEKIARQQEDNVRPLPPQAMAAAQASTSPSKENFSSFFSKEVDAYHARGLVPNSYEEHAAATDGGSCSCGEDHAHEQHHSRAAADAEALPTTSTAAEDREMMRLLAQNTLHNIQRSRKRRAEDNSHLRHDAGASAAEGRAGGGGGANAADRNTIMGDMMRQAYTTRKHGVQALLDYNKQWAAEVTRYNPDYFTELAKEQKPEYLWIGCSDSRVPANEVVGLHPGEIFVHRNIANLFSLSDMNCLSALQFAVDCLHVQHVIVAGHYKCGGVTAAYRGDLLGLTEHWIMQVRELKVRHQERMHLEISARDHVNLLCELNVLEQLSHVANCRILQRKWLAQNDKYKYERELLKHVQVKEGSLSESDVEHLLLQHQARHVRQQHKAQDAQKVISDGANNNGSNHSNNSTQPNNSSSVTANPIQEMLKLSEDTAEVDAHGWVYSLDDGVLRPLITLSRSSHVKKDIEAAVEAVFIRYSLL